MKIFCPLEPLRQAFALVSPFRAPPRSPKPVRCCLRIEVDAAGNVFLVAAGSDTMSARTQVQGCEVRDRGDGAGLIPGAKTIKLGNDSTVTSDVFSRLLDRVDGDCLSLEFSAVNGNPWLVIVGGHRRDACWRMPTVALSDWPGEPKAAKTASDQANAAAGVVRAGQFVAALRLAGSYAAPPSEWRPSATFLGAVHVLSRGDQLDFVATDGVRLGMATIPWLTRDPSVEFVASIERTRGECSSRRLVAALSKLDPLEEVAIVRSGNRLSFTCPSLQVVEAEAERRMLKSWRGALANFAEDGAGECRLIADDFARALRLYANDENELRLTLDRTGLTVASEAGDEALIDEDQAAAAVTATGAFRAASAWYPAANLTPALDGLDRDNSLTLGMNRAEFLSLAWSREGVDYRVLVGALAEPTAKRKKEKELAEAAKQPAAAS